MKERLRGEKVATVLMSGGVDSTACADFFKRQGFLVRGVFFDFGQPANAQERHALNRIKSALDIEIDFVSISGGRSFGAGELVGRNAFLILAALFLYKVDQGIVVIGVHSGTDYYDCSDGFIARMKALVEESTSGKVTISAPFLSWDKGQIFKYYAESGLPFEITYSCEEGNELTCGVCASCKDRSVLGC